MLTIDNWETIETSNFLSDCRPCILTETPEKFEEHSITGTDFKDISNLKLFNTTIHKNPIQLARSCDFDFLKSEKFCYSSSAQREVKVGAFYLYERYGKIVNGYLC